MSNLKLLLQSITFGKRVAEEELDELEGYFLETDQWRRVRNGDVDVVYGPKGSGKSAIYSLLTGKTKSMKEEKGVILVSGENPRGTTVFKDLATDPPAEENEFINLWKLYFLSLVGRVFVSESISNSHAKRVIAYLQSAQLMEPQWSLTTLLRQVRNYLKNARPETVMTFDEKTGQPQFVGRIAVQEPAKPDHVSIDDLFTAANEGLRGRYKVWIALDRLDVAFSEHKLLEENALRALFKVYLDLLRLNEIALKIFLRDDIWQRITRGGFREASHITRSATISWDRSSLLHLVVRRALNNSAIVNEYSFNKTHVLSNAQAQIDCFYKIFPKKVERGQKKAETFDWVLSRTNDGTRRNAPREIIHLLNQTLEVQLGRFDRGGDAPENGYLVAGTAFKEALPEVSKTRLTQTLYAEFPDLRSQIEKLRGQKTNQNISNLCAIWNVDNKKAERNCVKLAEVGFFEVRGTRESPEFWVPFLYRDALEMIQGTAD